MTASFGPPGLNLPEQNFANHGMMNARNYPNPAMAFGPPPGLPFRQGSAPSPGPVMSNHHSGHPDSVHGEFLAFHPQGREFVKNTERRPLPARKLYFRS